MPRLRTLEVSGIKSLRGARLGPLSDYNVIIGPSNAGKTTLMQALEWASYTQRDQPVTDELYRDWPRYYGENIAGEASIVLEIESDDLAFEASIRPNPSTIMFNLSYAPHGSAGPAGMILFRLLRNFRLYSVAHISQENVIGGAGILGRRAENLHSVLHYWRNNEPETFESVEQALRQINPAVIAIETPFPPGSNSAYTRLRGADGRRQPLISGGEGSYRAVALLAAVGFAPEGGLVVLDEPETGAHPSLQRRVKRAVRRLARERKIQLIVITHSSVWADVDDGAALFQLTAEGTVENVTSRAQAARALGARPTDLGFSDVALFLEGESEGVAMPILFAHFGETFEEMGIGPVNLRGQGTLKHAKQLVDLYRLPGARVHVVLDWADCPTETAETLAVSMGLQPNAVTLWTKEDGKTPGVFEDVFGVDVLCEAFQRQLELESCQVDESAIRSAIQQATKTCDALRDLYHEVTTKGLAKPTFASIAATICVERGFEPPQVARLRKHLESILST